MAMTVIFKQRVAAAHCSNEQILVAIVVGIGKGGCNADPAWQRDPGLGSDVSEFASTHVLPQFVATHLVHEVNVVESITIDVSDRDGAAMVIVTHPHVLAGVVHGVVSRSDAAFRQAVYEPKVVEDLELPGGFQLGLFSGGKGIGTHVFLRVARSGRCVSRGTEQQYP